MEENKWISEIYLDLNNQYSLWLIYALSKKFVER